MPVGTRGLDINQLKDLARDTAAKTLKRLRAEVTAIERTFPELALPKRRRAIKRSLKSARKKTRAMSATARKAVSLRMKKYWAERQKAATKVK